MKWLDVGTRRRRFPRDQCIDGAGANVQDERAHIVAGQSVVDSNEPGFARKPTRLRRNDGRGKRRLDAGRAKPFQSGRDDAGGELNFDLARAGE